MTICKKSLPLYQQYTKKMTISKSINISPLEVEIENKIATGYLYSIAAKYDDKFARKQFSIKLQGRFAEINQTPHTKTNRK